MTGVQTCALPISPEKNKELETEKDTKNEEKEEENIKPAKAEKTEPKKPKAKKKLKTELSSDEKKLESFVLSMGVWKEKYLSTGAEPLFWDIIGNFWATKIEEIPDKERNTCLKVMEQYLPVKTNTGEQGSMSI